MTKQEVVQDAQKYANMINRSVFVLRRGQQYKGSANEQRGWSVAEVVAPSLIVPKFVGAHEHILRVERGGVWLDFSSIRTQQDMDDAVRIVDANPSGRYAILDRPGMFDSKVVYPNL